MSRTHLKHVGFWITHRSQHLSRMHSADAHTRAHTHGLELLCTTLSNSLQFLTQVLFSKVVYSIKLFFFFPEWPVSVAYCWCCFRLKTKHRKKFVSPVSSLTQADPTRQGSLTTGNVEPTGRKRLCFCCAESLRSNAVYLEICVAYCSQHSVDGYTNKVLIGNVLRQMC